MGAPWEGGGDTGINPTTDLPWDVYPDAKSPTGYTYIKTGQPVYKDGSPWSGDTSNRVTVNVAAPVTWGPSQVDDDGHVTGVPGATYQVNSRGDVSILSKPKSAVPDNGINPTTKLPWNVYPDSASPSGYIYTKTGEPVYEDGSPYRGSTKTAKSGTWTGYGPKGQGTYYLDGPNGTPGTYIGPTTASSSSSGAAPRGIINGPSGGGGGGTSAAERNFLAEQAAQDAAAMERLKYQTGFQGSENALDRQLRAQEAAASEARYQRELQRQLALDYQKALTDVNPNAVRDFLYGSGQAMTAGNGGTFWNALAGGGDALTPEGVTPAAQLLGMIRGGGGLNTAASATGTAGVASPTIPYGNDTTAAGTPGAPPASGAYNGPGANGQAPSYTRWGGGASDTTAAGTPIPLPNAMSWEEYKAVTPGAMPSQYGAYLAEQAGYGMNTPQYDMQQTGVDQNGVPFTRQVTPEEQAWSEASASGLGGSIAQMNQAMGNYYGAKPTVGGVAVGANATDPFATPSPMQFTPATGQWSRVATSTGRSSNVIQEPKTVVPGLTRAARGTGGLPTRALTIAGDPSRDGVPNPETVTWTPRGNIIQPIRGGMTGVRRMGQRMPLRMFADGGSDYWDPNFDSSIYADTPQTTQPIAKPVTQPISQPPIQPSTGGDVSRPVALSTVSTSSGSSLAKPPAATTFQPPRLDGGPVTEGISINPVGTVAGGLPFGGTTIGNAIPGTSGSTAIQGNSPYSNATFPTDTITNSIPGATTQTNNVLPIDHAIKYSPNYLGPPTQETGTAINPQNTWITGTLPAPVPKPGTQTGPYGFNPVTGAQAPLSQAWYLDPSTGQYVLKSSLPTSQGTGNTMPGGVPGPVPATQPLPSNADPGSVWISPDVYQSPNGAQYSLTQGFLGYGSMGQQPATTPPSPTVGGLPATQTDGGLAVPTAGTGSTTVSQGQSDLINEILNQRRTAIVPGLDSSYLDVAFNNIPPSQRAAWYAGMQERYGVDPQDIMAEQQRYGLRGYTRGGLVGAVRR